MNYIVFDLEWNQGMNEEIEDDLKFEIIELAAIKLNADLDIIDEFRQVVRHVI